MTFILGLGFWPIRAHLNPWDVVRLRVTCAGSAVAEDMSLQAMTTPV